MNPGQAIAAAIALCARASVSEKVTPTIKGAYNDLKSALARRYPTLDFHELEMRPQSKASRAHFAKALVELSADHDGDLIVEARELLELFQSDNTKALARDSGEIRAVMEALQHIIVKPGVLDLGKVTISGTGNIVVGTSIVGVEPVDPWPQPGRPRK